MLDPELRAKIASMRMRPEAWRSLLANWMDNDASIHRVRVLRPPPFMVRQGYALNRIRPQSCRNCRQQNLRPQAPVGMHIFKIEIAGGLRIGLAIGRCSTCAVGQWTIVGAWPREPKEANLHPYHTMTATFDRVANGLPVTTPLGKLGFALVWDFIIEREKFRSTTGTDIPRRSSFPGGGNRLNCLCCTCREESLRNVWTLPAPPFPHPGDVPVRVCDGQLLEIFAVDDKFLTAALLYRCPKHGLHVEWDADALLKPPVPAVTCPHGAKPTQRVGPDDADAASSSAPDPAGP